MWFKASTLLSLLPLLASAAPVTPGSTTDSTTPRIDYEAIIVGGGPAGLAALSALARVRRRVLLVDSGVYRNGPTRHMHDVPGFDGKQSTENAIFEFCCSFLFVSVGVTPAYYRFAARQQIAHYGTVSMTNGTVTKITPQQNNTYFTVTGKYEDDKEITFNAQKIVLATGIKDLIPNTPGLAENFGKGIFWCPWCDGHEHADQGLGLLGPLESVPGTVREILSLNKDIIAFVNGTDTKENREATEKKSPRWQEYLKIHKVDVENRQITSIERLKNGSDEHADPSLPSHPEHDLFRVNFGSGEPILRNAFLTSFKDEQLSKVGPDMGVQLYGGRLAADPTKGLVTNIPGVYAIGDANSDNVTNVPHALFSGKRTAVFVHVQLERETAAKELDALKNSTAVAKRSLNEEAKSLWERMNGLPGDLLYAGEFDQ